jgi:hypothetical protein
VEHVVAGKLVGLLEESRNEVEAKLFPPLSTSHKGLGPLANLCRSPWPSRARILYLVRLTFKEIIEQQQRQKKTCCSRGPRSDYPKQDIAVSSECMIRPSPNLSRMDSRLESLRNLCLPSRLESGTLHHQLEEHEYRGISSMTKDSNMKPQTATLASERHWPILLAFMDRL